MKEDTLDTIEQIKQRYENVLTPAQLEVLEWDLQQMYYLGRGEGIKSALEINEEK